MERRDRGEALTPGQRYAVWPAQKNLDAQKGSCAIGKMAPEDGGSGRDSRLPTPVGQVMNPLALLTRQIFADHTFAATDLCTRPVVA